MRTPIALVNLYLYRRKGQAALNEEGPPAIIPLLIVRRSVAVHSQNKKKG